jgi:uncharacterized membrane protein YoaT (DUF817 family)
MQFLLKLVSFGYQQALCCIFPVAIFATLAFTKYVDVPLFYRYDFILLVCVCVQFLMVYFKLETIDELKVISLFHIIGLFLELYKVSKGSWAYPEFAYTKLGDVPIYSGFMYASVASYICQAWRRFDLRFHQWPPATISFPLAAAIYFNFFTLHYITDLRWVIIASLFFIFRKSYVTFVSRGVTYKMNIILSFLLIGSFIWLAENISTFLGAWQYPNQQRQWNVVHFGKLSSWFLLVIISIIIVANLKHIKYNKKVVSLKEKDDIEPTLPEPAHVSTP